MAQSSNTAVEHKPQHVKVENCECNCNSQHSGWKIASMCQGGRFMSFLEINKMGITWPNCQYIGSCKVWTAMKCLLLSVNVTASTVAENMPQCVKVSGSYHFGKLIKWLLFDPIVSKLGHVKFRRSWILLGLVLLQPTTVALRLNTCLIMSSWWVWVIFRN